MANETKKQDPSTRDTAIYVHFAKTLPSERNNAAFLRSTGYDNTADRTTACREFSKGYNHAVKTISTALSLLESEDSIQISRIRKALENTLTVE